MSRVEWRVVVKVLSNNIIIVICLCAFIDPLFFDLNWARISFGFFAQFLANGLLCWFSVKPANANILSSSKSFKGPTKSGSIENFSNSVSRGIASGNLSVSTCNNDTSPSTLIVLFFYKLKPRTSNFPLILSHSFFFNYFFQ